MNRLRFALIAMTIAITFTTAAAMAREGVNFIQPFVTQIAAMGWQGQFNLDFACYLILSALWIAWREGFSKPGLIVAAVAALFGILVFAPYLVFQIGRCGKDPRRLLLGVHADHGKA